MGFQPSRPAVSVICLCLVVLTIFSFEQGSSATAAHTVALPFPQRASMTLDQANTAAWVNAWTNLVNDVRQTFIPSLPKLLAIEVELVVGNPGPPDDTLTITVLDAHGRFIARVPRTVPANDCAHVLFVLPKGGVEVSPGQTYSLRLSGGTTFGWKYVVGGYEKGAACFNGRPLLPDARSTLLFRTFGAE